MSNNYHLFLCTGTTCAGQGAEESLQRLREGLVEKNLKHVRLTLTRCLGQCGNGPHMVVYEMGSITDATWYGRLTEEEIDPLISQHLIKGEPLSHLVREPVD